MKKYKIYAIILAIALTCLAGCSQSKDPIPGVNGQMVTTPTESEAPTMTDSTEAVLPTEKESSEAPTADTVVTESTESVTDATEPKEPDRQPEVTEPVPTAPVQTEPPLTVPPKEDAQPEPTEPTVPTAKPEPAPDPTKPTQPTQPSAPAEPPKETEPTEPVPTQPAPTEPKPTEPMPIEPEPTEPKPTEPTPTEPEPDTFTEADHRRIIAEVTAYAESYSAKGFTFQWKESMTFGWDVGYMGTPRVAYEGVDGVIEMLKYHIDLIYKTSTDPAYGLTTTVMTYKVEQITIDGDLAYVVIYGG